MFEMWRLRKEARPFIHEKLVRVQVERFVWGGSRVCGPEIFVKAGDITELPTD